MTTDGRRGRRKPTRTSSFGMSGRVGHDSSEFYGGKLYREGRGEGRFQSLEATVPEEGLDRIHCKSSEVMNEIPDGSVHLMVTSPPYNACKEYDEDLSLPQYRGLLKRVFQEVYRKLATGGRACVNIANLGRKPYIPLHSYIIQDMLKLGFLMRGEIIWDKGPSAGASTAWGSWKSAANPVLRDTHEYILVFSKDTFSRKAQDKESTMCRDEFLEWTKSVWRFPAASAKSVGHPAPFPEELPRRLIELFTFKGDVVLDPFCGAGTSCLAALKTGRRYVGYDIEPAYAALSIERIRDFQSGRSKG